MVNSISVSDIWQTLPVVNKRNNLIKKTETKLISNSIEEVLSFTLKAQPVVEDKNQFYIFRSEYSGTDGDIIPDEGVLFYFIVSDLKLQLINTQSEKSSFLNVYLLWKVIIIFELKF